MRRVKNSLAKASKRVLKKMNQLSMKGRKIVNRAKKMKFWGGMKYIEDNDRGNLIKIWDTFCQKRAKKFVNIQHPSTNNKTYALFVIDMQNDFIDRDYNREYNDAKMESEKNFVDGSLMGNFNVAQGESMIGLLISKLEDAIKDENCKYIIFSRDYHPVGHASFFYLDENTNMSNVTYKGSPSGCFPAHCVQGHSGSKLITEIEQFINDNKDDKKIKVIFKGIHPTVDSFTAVPMDTIDHIASNHKPDINSLCMECGEGNPHPCCSSVTGGFYIEGKNAVEAMEYMEVVEVTAETSKQVTYNDDDFINLESVEKIEVCGLAGDYCVRDTIVALAKKYKKEKEIVLLNYLTRYAFLPLFTIRTIPEHKAPYSEKFDPDTIGEIPDDELKKYTQIGSKSESRFEKDIKYYVFNCPLGEPPNLMKPDELNSINNNDFIFWPGLPKEAQEKTLPLTRKHFITGHEEILKDYNEAGGYVCIQWGNGSN